MSKMLIIMPSKQRAYNLKTTKWLLKCELPEGVDFKCICEPQEKIHYKASLGLKNLIVMDKNDMGLGYALHYGHKYAKENGYDLCFHIDDDVSGFIDKRVKSCYRVEVFENIVKDLKDEFENNPKLGLVRFISSRAFYFYKNLDKKFIIKNQLAWGCYITRVTPEYYRSEISNYSDTAAQLFFWRDGFYTLTYGKAGINVDVYSNTGGCQSRDRKIDAINAINELKKDFPNVCMKEANNSVGYDIDVEQYRAVEEKL